MKNEERLNLLLLAVSSFSSVLLESENAPTLRILRKAKEKNSSKENRERIRLNHWTN
ncbi:MAG: hypothetical protein JNJ47_07375 [Alphaproteobacteria bacterium]|nr:hypothetical protein [Alphaproteobacteria bacterium]